MRVLKALFVLLLAVLVWAPPASAGIFRHPRKINHSYKVPKYKYKKPNVKGHKVKHTRPRH